MPGSSREQSKNALYPGASQQLNRKRPDNIVNRRISSNEKPNLYAYKNASPDVNQNDKSIRSFDLDWIDHYSNNVETYGKKRLESQPSNNPYGVNLNKKSQEGRSNPSRDISILNRKMQAHSSTNLNPEISSFYSAQDSTLDINDDIIDHSSSSANIIDEDLAGQLTGGSPQTKQSLSDDYNQLDEPILDTLKRDLMGIYNKIEIIALPLSSYEIYKIVLRGWDLWGPLMLCTFLAFNLHHSDSSGPHFADIFVLVWFGSCMVSLNYRLLSLSSGDNRIITNQSNQQGDVRGSDMSVTKENFDELGDRASMTLRGMDSTPFQTLMSPPSIFQLMCVFGYCLVAPCFGLLLLKMFSLTRLFFERMIIGLLFGFAWPTICSIRILIRYQHPEKRALAIYPIGLFYFVLSCLIILNH